VCRYTDERFVSEERKVLVDVRAYLVVDEVTSFDTVKRSHVRYFDGRMLSCRNERLKFVS
jgi:hypothetical protein